MDPFTTYHSLPQPVTSSDVKGTSLSNDDVVRLDLQGLLSFKYGGLQWANLFSKSPQLEHHDQR